MNTGVLITIIICATVVLIIALALTATLIMKIYESNHRPSLIDLISGTNKKTKKLDGYNTRETYIDESEGKNGNNQ